jgi:hypothetical protein
VTPDDGPNWQIRAQVQFMFPKQGGDWRFVTDVDEGGRV